MQRLKLQKEYVRYGAIFIILFFIGFLAVRSFKAGIAPVAPTAPAQEGSFTIDTALFPAGRELHDHMLGRSDATYTVVYYVDYDCPGCASSLPNIQAALQKYPDVRFVVRQMPLTDIHPTAFKKAALAECLTKKGEDFFSLTGHLFGKRDVPASQLTAEDLGLANPSLFPQCVEDNESQHAVMNSGRGALSAGLYSTPSIAVIKGKEILLKVNFVSKAKLMAALDLIHQVPMPAPQAASTTPVSQ